MAPRRGSSPLPANAFEWGIRYAAAAAMLGLAGVMLCVAVARYAFSSPPIWSEDVPRVLSVWTVSVGAGVAIRLGLNVRVTSLVRRLPRRAELAVRCVMHLLVIAFQAVLCLASTDLIELNWRGVMLSTGWSNAALSLPLLVGGLIMLAYQARPLVLAGLALLGRIELVEGDAHRLPAAGAGLG